MQRHETKRQKNLKLTDAQALKQRAILDFRKTFVTGTLPDLEPTGFRRILPNLGGPAKREKKKRSEEKRREEKRREGTLLGPWSALEFHWL